jgi:hypothetical protein
VFTASDLIRDMNNPSRARSRDTAKLFTVGSKHPNSSMRALSIRRPYAEQILRGTKRFEYRSRPTAIRGRVYIYASLKPGKPEAFKRLHIQPGDLPTGVLVGTVEITECCGEPGHYQWHLARPQRLQRHLRPTKHPQPAWFNPF